MFELAETISGVSQRGDVQRGQRGECWVLPDPAVNETLPVPL